MDWAKPENSIWFIFLPVFIALAYYVFNWRKKTKAAFADSKLISKLFPKESKSNYWLGIAFIFLSFLFGIVSLMDPLFGEEKIKVKREGIDVIFALDLSSSMNTEDVAPSRLEKAKKIISQSIKNLGGDRVGLIVFAADAYSISPLTNDYSAIQSYINSANSNLISQQGTNFYDVMNKAAEMFGNAPNTGKLLVILTDGEDNESSVAKASDLAKSNAIHLAVLGIGTKNGGPIPNHEGNFQEYKVDRNGETVISKLDETSMKSLIGSTSGIYLRVNQTDTTVKNLHYYLNSLDKKTQDTAFSSDKKHIFQWFLAIALIFIFIDTLTTEHKLFNNKKQ